MTITPDYATINNAGEVDILPYFREFIYLDTNVIIKFDIVDPTLLAAFFSAGELKIQYADPPTMDHLQFATSNYTTSVRTHETPSQTKFIVTTITEAQNVTITRL